MPTRRLACFALVLAACSPSEEHAREQAEQALARGERDAAIQAIETLREVARETPDAYLELAHLWVQAGEAPRALWLLEEGAARFPENTRLRLFLANTALLVNDPARAETVARAIPERADEYPEALLVRARARVALGDLEAGLAAFREAEAERPGRAAQRIPRVAALMEERRFAEARAALDEAYAAVEDETQREQLRGVELALFQYQAADALQRASAAELEAAILGVRSLAERAPGDDAAWQLLTSLAVTSGRPELAEPALRAAQSADPGRAVLYPLVASIAIAKGDEAEAERQMRALAERSDMPAADAGLASYLASRGRVDEALALLDAALEELPTDEVMLFARAELLLETERLDDADVAITRVERLGTHAATAELLRARLVLARGDAAGARARLEQLAPRLDTAATQYWLARALELSGDGAGAAHRYRLSAVRDPSAPGPWLALLRLAQARGDWRETRQTAAAVLQRAPSLIDGWQGLVSALLEQGEKDAALGTAQRAVSLLGPRYEPHVLLAQALRAQGRSDEALAALDAAHERGGDRIEIAAERVLVLGLARRFDAAAAEAARASAALGDAAVLHQALAAALFQAGRAEDGAAEVERALALDPEDLRPLALRCNFEAATARYADALRSCGRYVEQRPEHAASLFALAMAQQATGQGDAAVASFRRAAALDPRAVAPRNNLALLLAQRGDLDGALAAAQEAYALAEQSPEVLDTLGWLYLKKGLPQRAVSLLEDAHARAPELADAQLHLALAYRAAGRGAEAEKLLAALRTRGSLSPELRAEIDAATATR
jgi:tetratricopeptide (TPR) repeat protein